MNYFLDSELFSPLLENLLIERNDKWSKTSNVKNSLLCLVEGKMAEKYFTKTKCNNMISFSTNYETGLINYLKNKGLMAIKDKGTCNKIFDEEIFIAPSKSFLLLKKKTIDSFLKKNSNIKKFVVKPSFFSASNEGVLVTSDIEEAKKHINYYGYKFPEWIIQEYIESKTEIPHYLKGDLFLVKNKITKELNLYFSNKIIYYGHRNMNNIERVINEAQTLELLKDPNTNIKGQSSIDAEKKFNSLYGKKYYKNKVLPQLEFICSKLLKVLDYKDILCYSKNLICCQYMSIDMILDKNNILKLIEINMVPTNHWTPGVKVSKKLKQIYPDIYQNNYIQDLLDDMLILTLDTIIPPKKRKELKYLQKTPICKGKNKTKKNKTKKNKTKKKN